MEGVWISGAGMLPTLLPLAPEDRPTRITRARVALNAALTEVFNRSPGYVEQALAPVGGVSLGPHRSPRALLPLPFHKRLGRRSSIFRTDYQVGQVW